MIISMLLDSRIKEQQQFSIVRQMIPSTSENKAFHVLSFMPRWRESCSKRRNNPRLTLANDVSPVLTLSAARQNVSRRFPTSRRRLRRKLVPS